ncbi:MAG: hypothetical protein G8345_08205 [Magnetococcales bacterium]|nr:hypothetical protein [Magnetococcales bacterium]NGZ26857.1 hypothetical protein [Magnetococcales bacterium]
MRDKLFDDLLKSIQHMKEHMAGQTITGVKTREVADIEPKTIQEGIGGSQREFACPLRVPVRQ